MYTEVHCWIQLYKLVLINKCTFHDNIRVVFTV